MALCAIPVSLWSMPAGSTVLLNGFFFWGVIIKKLASLIPVPSLAKVFGANLRTELLLSVDGNGLDKDDAADDAADDVWMI
jgi:hypothetical protein